jgi:Ca2+-binding EF-hand superfamily protein
MKRTVVIVLLFLALSHTAYSQNIPEGEVENIVQENTDLILQYDENSNGDLSREEAQRADQDYEGGEISRNQAEQITRLFNHQGSYKDYLIEAVVKENTELIDQYDENSDGEISISELGVAGTDYAEEKEVGSEELNYLELLFNTEMIRNPGITMSREQYVGPVNLQTIQMGMGCTRMSTEMAN